MTSDFSPGVGTLALIVSRVRRKNLLSSGSRSGALTFRRLETASRRRRREHFRALLLATLRWNVSFYAPFVGTITRNYAASGVYRYNCHDVDAARVLRPDRRVKSHASNASADGI